MLIRMLFRGNLGCMTAPYCYDMPTVPVLLVSLSLGNHREDGSIAFLATILLTAHAPDDR